RLLKRIRDISQVKGEKEISLQTTDKALEMLQVDNAGLDHTDHKLLNAVIDGFQGGPGELETIVARIGVGPQTTDDVFEPNVLQVGFIQRTPRGRVVTPKAYQHFGIKKDNE